MITIDINLEGIINELPSNKTSQDFISYAVQEIAEKFYDSWYATASEGLNSTRNTYVNALTAGGEGNLSFVKLEGKLPNLIEDGGEGWDMKEGFMNSPKAVEKKDGGWYFTVPFRHATPTAKGESSIFSNVMPIPIYKAVKNLEVLGANDIPKPYNAKGVRKEVITKSVIFSEYIHKHSKYEGLQKSTGIYENATQGTYVTFRRVSDKSDANSWIHKGFEAKHFMEKSLGNFNLDLQLDIITDNFLAES